MMKSLKPLLFLSLLCLGFTLCAQTPTPDSQLSQLWRSRNHDQVRTILEANQAAAAPDVGILHCSKIFYLFVQPDKAKAISAMTQLKQLADSSGKQTFVDLAASELAEVQRIPDHEFGASTQEALNILHSEFSDKFPNIEFSASLRRFVQP